MSHAPPQCVLCGITITHATRSPATQTYLLNHSLHTHKHTRTLSQKTYAFESMTATSKRNCPHICCPQTSSDRTRTHSPPGEMRKAKKQNSVFAKRGRLTPPFQGCNATQPSQEERRKCDARTFCSLGTNRKDTRYTSSLRVQLFVYLE